METDELRYGEKTLEKHKREREVVEMVTLSSNREHGNQIISICCVLGF
jgi:hypothetical protein